MHAHTNTQVDGLLVIPACRSMCLKVKEKCEPLLMQINFRWPQVLDCSKLPEKKTIGDMCIEPPGSYDHEPDHINHFKHDYSHEDLKSQHPHQDAHRTPKYPFERFKELISPVKLTDGRPTGFIRWSDEDHLRTVISDDFEGFGEVKLTKSVKSGDWHKKYVFYKGPPDRRCPSRFVHVGQYGRQNESCAARCGIDVLYTESDKKLLEVWMFAWAILCFSSTLLTLFTYAIKPSRFQYPQRPIIFMALCCLVVSCGYILRVLVGYIETACENSASDVMVFIKEGVGNTWCIVVFLLLYYFGMAGFIWWLILTISFYLSSARQWSSEAIEAKSNLFHTAAWSIPAIKTTIILILRKVDADELTGTCYVGNQNVSSMLFFVLLPLLAYLIVGVFFILAGFIAMFRIRRDLKGEGTNVNKFDRLMLKIGTFSILYTAPVSCVIGCLIHSKMYLPTWQQRSMQTPCQRIDRIVINCSLDQSIPNVGVSMLRIFMLLMIGTASGMWIWCPKTLLIWRDFLKRCFFKSHKQKVLMQTIDSKTLNPLQLAAMKSTPCTLSRSPSSEAIYHAPTFND